MIPRLLTVGALFLFFFLSGCGTLFNESPQMVKITSDPAGATVHIDGQQKGSTPLEVLLSTEQSHEVKVTAGGYPEQTKVLERDLSVLFIAGDIFMAVVPLLVDIYFDRLYSLDSDLHFQFAAQAAPLKSESNWKLNITPGVAPNLGFGNNKNNAGSGNTGSNNNSSGSSQQHCCLNGAYYECPSLQAVRVCAPPELAGCIMGCDMMDMSCPEGCFSRYPTDPSQCRRDASRDTSCK